MEFKRQSNHLEKRPRIGVFAQNGKKTSPRPRLRPVKTTTATPRVRSEKREKEASSVIPETINTATIELSTDQQPQSNGSPAPTATTPKATKPKKQPRRPLPKKTIAFTTILALSVGGFFTGRQYLTDNQLSISTSGIGQSENAGFEPDFTALLPSGKSIASLGGWQRVSPPENEPVYVYTDKINGVPINVSQQSLPESFKTNVDQQVAEQAKQFGATTVIDDEGLKFYIGTSAKGPQSVVTAKNGVLILIMSQSKVENAAWTDYVKALH